MNIQNIVLSLQKAGLAQQEIASEVGCSQPTISDIATGKVGKTRPSYKVVEGLRLLAVSRGVAFGDVGVG
jgi:predicted XRE-type DNA-binding protein